MSLNPPTLSSMSKIWYSAMNGATVPTHPHDALKTLNHRYSVFDRNINNIVSILSHGLKMGYLSQEQVMLAVTMDASGKMPPPFLVFKGAPNGQIAHEFQTYPDHGH